MIDPYIRTLLKNKENSPTFYTDLKVFYFIFRYPINMESLNSKFHIKNLDLHFWMNLL